MAASNVLMSEQEILSALINFGVLFAVWLPLSGYLFTIQPGLVTSSNLRPISNSHKQALNTPPNIPLKTVYGRPLTGIEPYIRELLFCHTLSNFNKSFGYDRISIFLLIGFTCIPTFYHFRIHGNFSKKRQS